MNEMKLLDHKIYAHTILYMYPEGTYLEPTNENLLEIKELLEQNIPQGALKTPYVDEENQVHMVHGWWLTFQQFILNKRKQEKEGK